MQKTGITTIVAALGGNALGDTAAEQLRNARIAAAAIVDLIEAGNRVVVVHGNGPQVGMIKKQFDTGDSEMPIAECTAMSQGYIGYHLQQSLQSELDGRGIEKSVASVLTQVIVDAKDPAFQKPSKPIGKHYDEETAQKLMTESGRLYKEDAGRGWRWVVPSPKPIDIRELKSIELLIENGNVVVACGGGGIPVVKDGGGYLGVDSVIDKDFAAAKLADLIDADILFILTAVERVCVDFNKPGQRAIPEMTIEEAKKLCGEGHFAPGSMLPKVEASIQFASGKKGRKAVIGLLSKAAQSIKGENGTIISI